MPVTVPGIMGSLIPSMISVSLIGTGVPKFSRGVALGLQQWIPQVKVSTVDTGTAGAGKNVPMPLIVLTPILYANILLGMKAQNLLGIHAPIFANGLSMGLTGAFLQMLVVTNHPSVGTGAGVATFKAPPAARSILSGFQQVGLKGPGSSKEAKALGMALDRTFASLIMPIAIVGPSSPSPGAGSGFGNIL